MPVLGRCLSTATINSDKEQFSPDEKKAELPRLTSHNAKKKGSFDAERTFLWIRSIAPEPVKLSYYIHLHNKILGLSWVEQGVGLRECEAVSGLRKAVGSSQPLRKYLR